MKQIDPNKFGNQNLHKLLQGGVAPRPIALASTIDTQGNPNLSPFSFYNIFGVNPTTLIFSPSRRGRDNTTKHTFENIKAVPQVVLNAVTFDMVQQISLSSTEYDQGVNEFIKSGLTQVESTKIRPYRVKESPLQFECKVREIIETGGQAGSANLVVCEIVFIHVDENILDENGIIDPDKIDLVGRLGGDYYVRTSGSAKFTVPKPLTTKGIGVDCLPDSIRLSKYLSGNDLGHLGNLESLPTSSELEEFKKKFTHTKYPGDEQELHQHAKSMIASGDSLGALKLLMLSSDQ